MYFFLQGYRVFFSSLLVACCVCNIPGGHTLPTGRGKRQPKEECTSPEYWDSTTSSCELCQCPAGQQNTAICGDGVGGKVCQDCPNGKFRGPSDHHSTCRQCTVCDPDAIVVSNCTRTEDTQCVCEKGLGTIRDHCVSCRDHPRADGCQTEDMNTTPAPHGGDDGNPDQDDSNPGQDLKESKNGQERGLSTTGLVLLCLFSGIVIGIAILALGICLHGIYRTRNSNKETRTDDPQRDDISTSGSDSPPVDVQPKRSQDDAPTPASASNGETDVMLNGNVAATLQNGSSNSINAHDISTSGEGPSSNSCPLDVQPERSQEGTPTPASASNEETDVMLTENVAATLQNGSSNSIDANQEARNDDISTSRRGYMVDSVRYSSHSSLVAITTEETLETTELKAIAVVEHEDSLEDTSNGVSDVPVLQNGSSNSM